MNRFSCLKPGLDWTRLFMSLTAGAGTRCMSLLPDSPTLVYFISLDELERKREKDTSKDNMRSLGHRVETASGRY